MVSAQTDSPRLVRVAGFTLLELVIVMAILSALLGIGVGAFRSLARPEQTALQQVKGALRKARLFARAEGVPASVVIQPARGQLFTVAMRTVGNWHFEDMAGTGWPRDADHLEGRILPDGALGAALALTGSAQLEIGDLPASSNSPHGFGVDVYVQPALEGRPMTLLERSGSWALELNREDLLTVRLFLLDTSDSESTVKEFVHEVPAARLSSDHLSRLTVVFDGRTLRVALLGARIEADTLFESPQELVNVPTVPVTTGVVPRQFRGVLDELRLASVIQGDPILLPEEVALEGSQAVVHVDAAGHLDPAWHRTPIRIQFQHGEPLQRTVVEYGLLGGLSNWNEPVDLSVEVEASGEAASQEGGAR